MQPALIDWASEHLDIGSCKVERLPVEASTRKFWRCSIASDSWILMDSPPDTENNEQFVTLSDVFLKAGVPVPQIIASNLSKGYLLVSDVGKQSYLSAYQQGIVVHPLDVAVETLLKIQSINHPAIPLYTKERLYDELQIFREYICEALLAISHHTFNDSVPLLVNEIYNLPKVTVHRDFHSKNLLFRNHSPKIGVVDFQDSLHGPLSYDLASLLFDCYWSHSDQSIDYAITKYLAGAERLDLPTVGHHQRFADSIKLTAIQRLLKAAGIFIRLWMSKNQTTHIPFVLPTLSKAQSLCAQLSPMNELGSWLEVCVIPQLAQRLDAVT